jgi:hypothetical protein
LAAAGGIELIFLRTSHECEDHRREHEADSDWTDSPSEIFSFVNSVLLRPLPYPNADRLAIILSGQGNGSRAPVSTFELFHIREQTREFDQVAGIWVTNGTLPGEGDAEQVKRGVVTSNFLPLLCTKPALGRFFSSEDEDGKQSRAIIISHGVSAQGEDLMDS